MLIAAFFEYIKFDVTIWMPMLSFVMGVWLLGMIIHTLHVRIGMSLTVTGLAGLVYATFVPTAVWTTSGLATTPQAALMFAAFVWLTYGDNRRDFVLAGVFALMLALVRTEGIAWGVVIAGVAVVSRLMRERSFRDGVLVYFGVLLSGFALYFAWRYSYYETVFSNTAHAKVDPSAQSFARGIQYVSYYGVLMLSPLLIIPAAFVGTFGKDRAHALGFAAMTVGVPTYALVVSGDYMAYFRMMVPGVPFMAVSFGFLFRWAFDKFQDQVPLITSLAFVVSLVGVLPGYDLILAPERLVNAVQTRLIKFESLERDLAMQGLEIADRDEYLFGFGTSFHLRRPRNEYKRWERMKENPFKWKAEAQGLLQVLDPDARLVTGAIGALGYYSRLYIYDQHGLVDGDVAERKEREHLRWPGHDKYVNKTYYLKRKPDVLEYQVVFGSNAAFRIAQIGDDFDKPAPGNGTIRKCNVFRSIGLKNLPMWCCKGEPNPLRTPKRAGSALMTSGGSSARVNGALGPTQVNTTARGRGHSRATRWTLANIYRQQRAK